MEDRKKDHLNMAYQSKIDEKKIDHRFCYEPMLSAHPKGELKPFAFAGKTMQLPIWVSSMTGGTSLAGEINRNLARVCNKFGMGMGLGSCRVLLDNPSLLPDFNVRPLIGNDQPLYANLGICQLEKMIEQNEIHLINELIEELKSDGIIIHVNPLQEAFQPEGDQLHSSPIDIIEEFLSSFNSRIIVKEVGQGMGYESLKSLLQLPIEAIEFGALGGTNFSIIELNRHDEITKNTFENFAFVGHTANEMTNMINNIISQQGEPNCKQLIISGGITSVLDGYYLTNISKLNAVFGMGYSFLKYASINFESLNSYVENLKKGWQLCDSFLRINQPE
ncbi:MAG: type 2 isopentenyl-diphosphate Delta-isomerase [Marinilabiliaceae bacterium]|nr:type 2 isopentenyl-diphosphate Delta-isomerase [Marinilabiliaceae bacterium]